MKQNKWRIFLAVILVLPVLLWLNWRNGVEVAHSRQSYRIDPYFPKTSPRSDFILIIRKRPSDRFTSNPLQLLTFWIDKSESRGVYKYDFAVYTEYSSTPVTTFTCFDRSNDSPFGTPVIKWSNQKHFTVKFDGRETIHCQFVPGELASWRGPS